MIDNYLHTIEADEQHTCEHADPIHAYRTRVDDAYGPTRRDEGEVNE